MRDMAIVILMVILGLGVIGLTVWLRSVAAQGRRAMRGRWTDPYEEDEE
jgi:hypothetical protein